MKGTKENGVTFEIVKHICTISSPKDIVPNFEGGLNKELNLVSWNGEEAKFDIRSWSEDHTKLTRGITLNADEMTALFLGIMSVVGSSILKEDEARYEIKGVMKYGN